MKGSKPLKQQLGGKADRLPAAARMDEELVEELIYAHSKRIPSGEPTAEDLAAPELARIVQEAQNLKPADVQRLQRETAEDVHMALQRLELQRLKSPRAGKPR